DLGHQVTLLKHVRSLAREGVGSLVVLHDLNLAAAYADQVVLLKDGEVFEEGPPETVLTSETLSAVYDTEIMVDRAKTGQQIIQPVLTA
ncbi:MAG: hemin ABC transporter ATP-binding protein, partial [Pseudomonadota bacterium]